jgi:hypothetical protein
LQAKKKAALKAALLNGRLPVTPALTGRPSFLGEGKGEGQGAGTQRGSQTERPVDDGHWYAPANTFIVLSHAWRVSSLMLRRGK